MTNKKLTYHFHKIVKVIRSCNNIEQLLTAKLMIVNFANYWYHQKLDANILSSYLKYLNILIKHKRNSYD
jgi:hypothetical protein